MNSNQEPSPELDNGESCQGLLRRFVHKIINNNEISPLNDMDNKTVKNIFPYFPISLFLKKKLAFTLAEVLITLGIIGVVAAITIPMLRSAFYEKQTVSRLLETQSILSQAIKSAEEEYGEVGGWDITGQNEASAKVIADKIKPFLKLALDCGNFDENGACFPQSSYKALNGGSATNYASERRKYKFMLLNGVSFTVQPIYRNLNNFQINIDVNGPSKPNIVGKDLFLFQYNGETRSLYPMGAPSSIYPYQTNCTKNSAGLGCAYYVTQFQNMKYLH